MRERLAIAAPEPTPLWLKQRTLALMEGHYENQFCHRFLKITIAPVLNEENPNKRNIICARTVGAIGIAAYREAYFLNSQNLEAKAINRIPLWSAYRCKQHSQKQRNQLLTKLSHPSLFLEPLQSSECLVSGVDTSLEEADDHFPAADVHLAL